MFFKPSEWEITSNLDRFYKLDSKIYSCLNDVSPGHSEYSHWQRQADKLINEKNSLLKWFRKHGIDF